MLMVSINYDPPLIYTILMLQAEERYFLLDDNRLLRKFDR
jgi:hypothetical protein